MRPSEIAAKLEAKGAGEGRWIARCPAHDDREASLSLGTGDDGRALLKCHAGCDTEKIAQSLGLALGDLFPEKLEREPRRARGRIVATYDYRDEDGELVTQRVRYEPKSFGWRRPDGRGGFLDGAGEARKLLYRLPELLRASPERPVFVVEGEKDCDRLRDLGLVAVTSGAASSWGDAIAEQARYALRGRRVIVVPDNDPPGRLYRDAVVKALAKFARVSEVELPGLPEHGDVSDWLDAGGTAERLLELAEATDSAREESALGFQGSAVRVTGEADERRVLASRRLAFNVTFLDDALGGILPNDLVVIGARTGAGKTQLASLIAQENAKAGRRVHYFALEAEPREIERRMKYRILVDAFFQVVPPSEERNRAARRLSYRAWYAGEVDDVLGQLERAADAWLAKHYSTLSTYYRGTSFTVEDLERGIRSVQDDTDLVVLDHLHYVDGDDPSENRLYKQVVKRLRDISLTIGKPVVLIAHLRKKDRGHNPPVPDIDDFHGTSDVVKIATKVILIARAPREDHEADYVWPTYMHAAKDRMDGGTSSYVARLTYSSRTGGYQAQYRLGRVLGDEFVSLPAGERLPYWAEKGGNACRA